ncbi:iron transporter FeoA [Mycolicibacter minnesotensis]|uniref:Iron transporter FeoA n=1 Tax=Mycolicibacter minnesotensis TaxID=1118379 RepID=A0A7I7RB31_9MYCO|nr:FeoA family protein [Mycolicibacter minnesotensis]ORB01572.1 iron transporter FeoA [Mycolicibacter minnesotensis]BBY35761.1 iron transporter FeoA [Mycolicibacter minnesotensis]
MSRWRRQSSRRSGSVTVLADLAPGQRATITGAVPHAPEAVAGRLRQLGFRAAARVDVIRRAPLGDPTIYRVQDTELCLRRREAQLIQIDAVSDDRS